MSESLRTHFREPPPGLTGVRATDQLLRLVLEGRPGWFGAIWRSEGEVLVPDSWTTERPPRARQGGVVHRALERGEPLAISGGTRGFDGAELERNFQGATCFLAAPCLAESGCMGVLALWTSTVDEAPPEFRERVAAAASQAAVGIEVRRLHTERVADARIHRELEIAGQVQRLLLETAAPTNCAQAEVGVFTLPSQKVDGDFFEFLPYGSMGFDVFVGDVMGKGLPAALVGAAVKSGFFRTVARLFAEHPSGGSPGPEVILEELHRDLGAQLLELATFVTACHARFDFQHGVLRFVDCGHTQTLHYDSRTREARPLVQEAEGLVNLPLGMHEDVTFRASNVFFGPGDLFVFYSDGLTEARNPAGAMYGEGALRELIERNGDLPARDLADRVREDVLAFCAGEPPGDDFTCLVVEAIESPMLPSRVLSLTLPPPRGYLGGVRALARELAPRGTSEVQVARLEVALVEAVTNVVRHAHPDGAKGELRLTARVDGARIAFELRDGGLPLEPSRVRGPTLDGTRSSGFGIHMLEQVMEEVRYERTPDGANVLRMYWTRSEEDNER